MRLRDTTANQSVPQVPGLLIALGIALIVGGLIAAIFVALEVLGVYNELGSNVFINDLALRFGDVELLSFGSDPLIFTAHGAVAVAILFFILLAWLGLHLALALIRAGVNIVSPAFPYQLRRIRQKIQGLRNRMMSK